VWDISGPHLTAYSPETRKSIPSALLPQTRKFKILDMAVHDEESLHISYEADTIQIQLDHRFERYLCMS